jgi:catechol 2,3-dioxygenase
LSELPRPQLRHMGVYTFDPDTVAAFYSHWFGMVISDVGTGSTGHRVIFMTGDPREHHQIAFANGRQPEWPGMNQISFLLETLTDLKQMAVEMHKSGVTILQQKDHGNSWSLYVADPEGNRIELYTPTPWYVSQPIWWPLDLVNESVETIQERTRVSAQAHPSFMTREAWMAATQARIDALR